MVIYIYNESDYLSFADFAFNNALAYTYQPGDHGDMVTIDQYVDIGVYKALSARFEVSNNYPKGERK